MPSITTIHHKKRPAGLRPADGLKKDFATMAARILDGPGWYVVLVEHGWLCGSREHALREFYDLVKIERTGSC